MGAEVRSLWIINYFAGNRSSGWGERHFFLAKELVKRGDFRVTIISSTYNHMFSSFPNVKTTFSVEDCEGVQFCWVKSPRYDPKTIARFWAMVIFAIRVCFVPKRLLKSPNYILVSSMPLFSVLSGLYLKVRFKADKFLFEVRDLWPLTPVLLGNISRYNPLIVIMKVIETIGYRKADVILSVLPKANLYINPISHNPIKLHYLPNGIGEEVVTQEPLPFKIEDVIPSKKFIVGYAGTLGHANAMEYVIDSARIMHADDRFHFVILGDGYLKSQLIERAHGLTNITFIPRVKKGQVIRIIDFFDVGIISWRKSSLYSYGVSANKFFDYMLCGKPILVAGDLGEDPVTNAKCGLIVEPQNPKAICEGLFRLLELSIEQRREMGLNGLRYVKSYHTYTVLADKLIKILSLSETNQIQTDSDVPYGSQVQV